MDRQKVIVRTSIIGILANVFLAGFKAAVGLISNSISVVLDAVNNLSDALSSVITIIGAKLSTKPSDKKHPMDYSPVALIIISVAVLVKIILGTYVMRKGKSVNSDSLVASGKDALMDSIISASVLLAAVIYLIWGVSLEAYLGVIISIFIIKAGFDVLRDTISQILGERIDSDLSKEIKESLCAYPQVSGAYDLILHAYGPETLIGSVHIEVDHKLTAVELDVLERRITAEIYQKHQVALTGISIYSVDLDDPETDNLFHAIENEVMKDEHILQIHGFNLDKNTKTVVFDLIVGFDVKDRRAYFDKVVEKIEKAHPDYKFFITLDTDISD